MHIIFASLKFFRAQFSSYGIDSRFKACASDNSELLQMEWTQIGLQFQGKVLGRLLFSMYINDISTDHIESEIRLFCRWLSLLLWN